MFRAVVQGKEDRILIVLGLSKANIARMQKGEPVLVKAEDLNLTAKIDILIAAGDDEVALLETLEKDFGIMVGPETTVHIDPRLVT